MIANNNTYSITVPSTLASGNYVFRHEIIAMHGAGSEGGAQNYPFCMNIAITGGGSDSPSGTLGTALYTSTGTCCLPLPLFSSACFVPILKSWFSANTRTLQTPVSSSTPTPP